MRYFPLIFLFLSHKCECRVATSETEIVAGAVNVKERPALHLPCTFRSLQGGDPYPSVVVKWQDQVQRFTWTSDGEVAFDKNYKQPTASHSYPSSGGLSGGNSAAATDPFANAPVVQNDYAFEDILSWFRNDCTKPY